MNNSIILFGKRAMTILEQIGLVVIAIATVFAAGEEVMKMFHARTVTLGDLLLMFLYLEVLTMVSYYFGTGKLPIRYPLYIGMVALARYLILDMKDMDGVRIIEVAAAILILAVAVLVIRYGHLKFSYSEDDAGLTLSRKEKQEPKS